MRRASVLVVDDHDVVRSGMRWLLRRAPWVKSCVCASTTADALALVHSLNPDVALVGVHLGDESGLQACLELRQAAPKLRVALLSSRWDLVPARVVQDVGALGVVSRDARARDMHSAVYRLADGLEVDVPSPHPERLQLLPWDREILRLAAEGFTNAEIGARIHLASGTVKQHMGELFVQLGVSNRAAAVHAARRIGVIPLPPAGRGEPAPPPTEAPSAGAHVLIADGADATRAGMMVALRREPWVALCRGVGRAVDTLRIAKRAQLDVALVGTFRGGDDVEVSRALTAAAPTLRTVLVREQEPPAPDVMREARAAGVVLKSWDAGRVAATVRAVYSDTIAERPHEPADGLSPREREVLHVLMTGATNAAIASRLGLSPHTVKQHTRSIYRKLGVRNRASAAGHAQAIGLVPGT